MSEKCILIKTKDNRNFITKYNNLSSLIEFTKTFGAEVYSVNVLNKSQILSLKDLTEAFCNPEYKIVPEVERMSKIYPRSTKNRESILIEAKEIREHIKQRFLSGKPVSLKELKKKYENLNLTDACLCNHMSVVRKMLSKEGYKFKKLGAGKYSM